MPELPAARRGLARRVVQDRRPCALSRAGGNGLPFLCGQPVGFQQGKIGPAPPGVPLVRRYVDSAAGWAPLGAKYAGGTLHGYISTPGPGSQYANYWTPQEV